MKEGIPGSHLFPVPSFTDGQHALNHDEFSLESSDAGKLIRKEEEFLSHSEQVLFGSRLIQSYTGSFDSVLGISL